MKSSNIVRQIQTVENLRIGRVESTTGARENSGIKDATSF